MILQNRKLIKKDLSEGKLTLGSWITLAHPAVAEIMTKAGFDWLAVDLEHSVITIRECEELIRVIDLQGLCPLVRLSSNDPIQIKRVMDAGAHGIIVPMVCSKADALAAVSALYYPMRGRRGVGLARAQGYGAAFQDYQEWSRENTVLIVQIESIQAVEQLDEIFAVPDIDGYLVGPYDLSASMGIPGDFQNPQFVGALNQIHKTAARWKKPGGIHIVEPDIGALSQSVKDGFKLIAYSVDTRMLDRSCRQAIDTIRTQV